MTEVKKKKNIVGKFLDIIEAVGNKLPHPAILFVIFSLIVVGISALGAYLEWEVSYTAIDRANNNEVIEKTDQVVSLANANGIRYIFTTAVKNFISFAPLGTVLVALLGVGVAEGSGFIGAALKKLVLITPKWLITCVLVFAGVMSNVASDAGYVVLVPLGAVVFYSFGRHPLAGLAATFAGVSGGFSANLLVGTIDPLLGGISTEAAKLIDGGYSVTPVANWYFMIASTFIIVLIGWFVTEKIVEPRLGKYTAPEDLEIEETTGVSKNEGRGLWGALIGLVLFITLMLVLTVPEGAPLRHPETGEIIGKTAGLHYPFIDSIVFIIALFFLFIGIGYGVAAKTIKSGTDVINSMSKAMATMGGYLVLAFFAAQFINYFTYTNLGTVLAVKGADLLQAINFKGLPLILAFIVIAAFVNLFIGSASAKWAILAPVFIPMFMQLGISPEMTQLAYRIGDSTTNIISPLMSYFAVIIVFAYKYDKKAGMGTIVSMMVPYSFMFLIGWTILLVIWYLTGLPIGPDIPVTYG